MAVKQFSTVKEILDARTTLLTEARSFLDQHQGAEWTEEREATYNAMIEDVQEYRKNADTLQASIDRRRENEDRLRQMEDELDSPITPPPSGNPNDPNNKIGNDGATLRVRNGAPVIGSRFGSLSDPYCWRDMPIGKRGSKEYRDAFAEYIMTGNRQQILAALQSDNDEQAGYLVASEQLAAGILQDVDDLLFVRRYATIHTVPEAHSLGIRKRTARLSSFAFSAELQTPTADTALKYGKKILTPHHLTGEIKVSIDLLRRRGDVEGIVRGELSRDAGEEMEDKYFTGHGAQQPLGVFTASADGISTNRDVSTGNSTTAIGADNLRECKYTLKSQYRGMGPRWLFHRTGVKQISKLKDGNGQYLWQPGITEGDPDRVLGYPIDESERAPSTFTTGLYVGLLAVWRYYEIADALDLEIQRLVELHARTHEVGFIGRLKTDGMPTLEEAFVRVKLA